MTTWPAPAKLNLFLHITGQRDDGYHELQTIFQFIDYCDTLSFEITETKTVSLSNSIPGVADEDNLIIKAAYLLQSYTNVKQGAVISLNKRLPMGGGLGGGSSNAATTLVALNVLWQCNLSSEKLAQLGLSLGADIPVFIHGHAAWAEGVGEKLTPISPEEPWYVIISPNCHISTSEIFSSKQLTRDCKPIKISGFLSEESKNVCEEVVKQHYPPVAEALEWLGQYSQSRMTGTGACIFASFESKECAEDIVARLPSKWQGFVAKGCNQSPLITHLL